MLINYLLHKLDLIWFILLHMIEISANNQDFQLDIEHTLDSNCMK